MKKKPGWKDEEINRRDSKDQVSSGGGGSIAANLFYHGAVSLRELPETTGPERYILTPDAQGVSKMTLTVGSFSGR